MARKAPMPCREDAAPTRHATCVACFGTNDATALVVVRASLVRKQMQPESVRFFVRPPKGLGHFTHPALG